MTQIQLGRLERVDLREAWKHEANDFTPWLALEENISLLADTIGIELKVEAQEKSVGPFRADILCKDTATDNWVLIENQLERTDHPHLGQLITYAAGLHAVTIVWIAQRFTEQHRATLDWPNEATREDINFFGLEIELWRISNSAIAPKFNVVSSPNVVTKRKPFGVQSVTDRRYFEFWTQFGERIQERKNSLRPPKPSSDSWRSFSIGRSDFSVLAWVSAQKKMSGVQLGIYGVRAKANFRMLTDRKAEIEKQIGTSLQWRELPERKESQILLVRDGFDLMDDSTWPHVQDWLIEQVERFDQIFRPIVKTLDAESYESATPYLDNASAASSSYLAL